MRWRIMRREQFLGLARAGAGGLTRPLNGRRYASGRPSSSAYRAKCWWSTLTGSSAIRPSRVPIVPAYTNGMVGYVATASAIARGGYEVHSSFDYYGGLPLRGEVEPLILSGVAEMLTSLYDGR
jgi:hypothetical protein